MSSIIEGYSYDVFISYRQKDNKYDGWVTEFVDNLKRELDSMFKDEVTVYFDINPSDYLLESYDVDASLKDKLKCLIFIPIISRTYCDPKAFAWDNEFKAFVNIASSDQFGFKVRLPNGNVANRVFPIRIHDLDVSDIKLFESVVGGVMRSIDFVYKETGVNRQLRAKDDDILIKTTGQNLYRDQINKVALTIKEIIEGLKLHAAPEILKEKEIKNKESEESKQIKFEEVTGDKEIQFEQEVRSLKKVKRVPLPGKSKILIPSFLITLVILSGIFIFLNHHNKVKWAKEEALTDIESFINALNFPAAFNLVQEAEKYISKEPKFQELVTSATSKLTVLTDPPDVDVYFRNYSDKNGEWKILGRTPIDSIKIPRNTFFLVKLEKNGYENVIAIAGSGPDTLFRKLFKKGTISPGMVYVEGYREELAGDYFKEKNGFLMDRYEITNKQYREFLNNGGYRKPEYWKNEFIKNGKKLTWDDAMIHFTDKTGRPGPSTWEAGGFPEGLDDYPVSGISWYEAAAYAEYAGKSLPTKEHWNSGAGFYIPPFNTYYGSNFNSKIVPLSNFNGKGPEPVGEFQGISFFGIYDMAGNVREWCWNETQDGHICCGGAWDDPTYLYSDWISLPSFDRSAKNGFRCVQYIGKEKIPESAFQMIEFIEGRDFSKEEPVADNIFTFYLNQFLYDTTDLQAIVEEKEESSKDWTIEMVTYNAAYGNERVVAYLYLPTNSCPPYQTLIFFPGMYAVEEKDLKNSRNSNYLIDFIIKSGHALMYPVYKGTFQRNDGVTPDMRYPNQNRRYTELLINWVKDFSRTIDYLETRSDIDKNKIGYYGHSWGGRIGGIIPAVENRLKLSILVIGGNGAARAYPEADVINYLPRIKIPVLMLNGRYDSQFPLETSVKPFFNLIGTSEKDKRLCIYETDHYVPKTEMIKETLTWLDKYFGPVNYQPNN